MEKTGLKTGKKIIIALNLVAYCALILLITIMTSAHGRFGFIVTFFPGFALLFFINAAITIFLIIKKYGKRWMWFPFLTVFFLLQFLNFSGFCYSDLRWYSKRQLVDIYLFGPEGLKMTEAEKIKKLKEDQDGEYPDCCRTHKYFSVPTFAEKLINGFLGSRIYEIEINSPDPDGSGPEEEYYTSWYSLTTCGGGGLDFYGEPINEDYYKFRLKMNQERWQGKRK